MDSAKETIELLNPDVTVKTYAMRLTPENIGDLIEEYDFVVDGVDNFETKFLINDACACRQTILPWRDPAVSGTGYDVCAGAGTMLPLYF